MAEHLLQRRTYYTVYAILMVCTYLTWQVAYFDLGSFNTVAALGIAAFKAVLVILFFMHVRGSPRLVSIVVISGLFWLGILLALTMSDYIAVGCCSSSPTPRCRYDRPGSESWWPRVRSFGSFGSCGVGR